MKKYTMLHLLTQTYWIFSSEDKNAVIAQLNNCLINANNISFMNSYFIFYTDYNKKKPKMIKEEFDLIEIE